MGSTYTDNGGIEKIGLGEQAGAWGTTTNKNTRYSCNSKPIDQVVVFVVHFVYAPSVD